MENVQWEPIDVTPNNVPRGKPYARITPNSVTFNGVAAGMIHDIGQYPWAVLRVGLVEGEPALLAFQFVREQVEGAFPVKRQSKSHKGVTFFSRELVKRYFNLSGVGLVYMNQGVEKLDDTTLAIQLPTEESVVVGLGLDMLEDTVDDIKRSLSDLIVSF